MAQDSPSIDFLRDFIYVDRNRLEQFLGQLATGLREAVSAMQVSVRGFLRRPTDTHAITPVLVYRQVGQTTPE